MPSVLVAAALIWLALGSTTSEVVKTPLGSVAGGERTSRDGRTYLTWTKIPFAKPPVGNLRLAAPVPVEKWDGVLQATEPMPGCRQGTFMVMKSFEGDEDCLYVSVYKPKIDTKNLPVVFYVHGGAFAFGHPGEPEMADYIMDEDVILVTTTYRVGALGFMSLNDEQLPGNFGLKDQALALRWVHDNIRAFGGDPEAITVFGESAGGASAHYLLLSPLTRDMVKGAFAVSGTVNRSWSQAKSYFVKNMTEKLVDELDCKRSSVKETVECLREIDDPSIFAKKVDLINPQESLIPFGPSIEPAGPGAFASEDLTEAKSTKPLVTSFSAGEYLLSEIPNKLQGGGRVKKYALDLDAYSVGLLKGYFQNEELLKSAAARVKDRYLKHDKKSMPELIHDVAMIFQDLAFVYPALDLAENHIGPKWMYQFVHRGELSLFDSFLRMNTTVACHGDEIFYFFNKRSGRKNVKDEEEPNDVRVSKELIKYLVNFATYGNPTPQGSALSWTPYKGNEILQMKTEGSEMADADFVSEQKDILEFWRDIFKDATVLLKDEL